MTGPKSRLEIMRAAAMIQNPMVRPRQVKPEDVLPSGEAVTSAYTQAQTPKDARDVAGASEGVMKAERAESEGAYVA